MNKKNISIGAIVLLVALTAVWFISQGGESGQAPVEQEITTSQSTQEISSIEDETVSLEYEGEIKEFVITGTNFKFSLDEIRATKGDMVRIVFRNGGGTHNWTIDKFNARTQIIQTGQEEVIEFVVDKAGEFEYYCSVGGHRALGMKGMLIVE